MNSPEVYLFLLLSYISMLLLCNTLGGHHRVGNPFCSLKNDLWGFMLLQDISLHFRMHLVNLLACLSCSYMTQFSITNYMFAKETRDCSLKTVLVLVDGYWYSRELGLGIAVLSTFYKT